MSSIKYLAIGLLALLLGACTTIPKRHLPSPEMLNCCWQQHDSVIVYPSAEKGAEGLQLSSAIVVQAQRIQMVLMDSFGRKLVEIIQNNEGITVWQAPELDNVLPLKLLLLSIYLSHLDEPVWATIEGDWVVNSTESYRSLAYGKTPLLSLRESADGNVDTKQLQFAQRDMLIVIKTLVKTDLGFRS